MRAHCHVCGRDELELNPQFSRFRRVTSDCRPFRAGGEMGECAACGTVQAHVDDKWRADCREIYESYAIYYQGGGAEQKVFDASSGSGAPRSERLLEHLARAVTLRSNGRLADIGCGNGNFLRAFNARFPTWRLVGSEYDETHRITVELIPGVEAFSSKDAAELPGVFDAISLIHVLEHIEAPLGFLKTLRAKMTDDGLLIVELPLYTDNPFELLIADHASHFEAAKIGNVLSDAGFGALTIMTDWIPKELSVVAQNGANSVAQVSKPRLSLTSALTWLESVRQHALELARSSQGFGIFGTSIGATWLWSELEGRATFFVDEDPNRAGGQHFDLPIYHPDQIPGGSAVYVALPSQISRSVAQRLNRESVEYHQVPFLV